MKDFTCDVLIVGTGVAGLYSALKLPDNLDIVLITKAKPEECDSYLAQGGICVLKSEDDYDSYFEDTMKAGHYANNPVSINLMIRNSQKVIKDLIGYGTRFEKDDDGNLKYTREGAHSTARILFHEDITGEEITSHLLEAARQKPNIRIYQDVTMIDILKATGTDGTTYCSGVVAVSSSSEELKKYSRKKTTSGKDLIFIKAHETIWACGGIGGLYQHSTNYPHLTGDALGIALKHGIPLQDPDYIQIHPTTFYTQKKERSFLISESVRGEGGILLDKNGKRFVNELLPRDVVANDIFEQMKKDDTEHVMLSMENIPKTEIKNHFKHIYEHCLEEGYDCTKEPIPVVPAQHYFMGGIAVDSSSRTSMNALYAIGETSCNGVHGKNRLASNSLLESLVFAGIAAKQISEEIENIKNQPKSIDPIDPADYMNTDKIFEEYKKIILSEIKRMKEYHERHNNENEHGQFDTASA